ncbi:two-component regulator propeller domain-containing protein [Parasediminibacterium sp. JCM 36343]|uniref:hybrid sensor histidine kinase/response regulator transcription factor n=1 Tax=Parasediminibacterium sp. JCM 36343 TaxID=3374279 RepID=UPI00397D4EA8
MHKWLTIAFIIFFFVQPVHTIAQPQCNIKHFSTANGLSDNRVMYIIKDHEGFMWMGTWAGINRFDGQNFTTFKSYPGDQSELKSNRIDFIVEDKLGFLWLKAYDKQVYRFDKKTGVFLSVSKRMQTENGGDGSVEKIMPLQNNEMAITTKKQGFYLVAALQSDSLVCKRFSKAERGERKLPSDSITCFFQDSYARLWLATNLGLSCFKRGENGEYEKVSILNTLQNAGVTCINESAGIIWFGTKDGKLISLDKASGKIASYNASNSQINALKGSANNKDLYLSTAAGEVITYTYATSKLFTIGVLPGIELLSIYEDHRGMLWVEPKKEGVVLFNPQQKTVKHFIQHNYSYYLQEDEKYHVFEDSKGMVWVNMKGCGFGYYDVANATFKSFFNEQDSSEKKFSNMVVGDYFDPDGILWLASDEGGLEKIVFPSNHFNHAKLTAKATRKAENEVRGLYSDKEGRVWITVKSKEIYLLENGSIKRWPLLENLLPKVGDGGVYAIGGVYTVGGVYAILEDRKGNIWFGTKGAGLFKATPLDAKKTNYQITHFVADAKNPYAISSNLIYSLLEDKLGRIWVGTYGGGVNLIDEEGAGVKFYNRENVFKKYPVNACGRVRRLACDNVGRIWIGTTEGLLLFDPMQPNFFNSPFVRYNKIPGKKESLGGNDIQFIYKDHKNTMWVLTSSGGLNKAVINNPMQSLSFINYSVKDGLPSDYLLSCIEDSKGFLWIATLNGLARFNLATGIFRNFDADVLPDVNFSEASCTATQAGEFIFGTTTGYLQFNPLTIVDHKINANIALTNLQINNQDVFPGEQSSPLRYSVNNTDKITLHYNENVVSIDYAVLDYRSEVKESYSFRLIGLDSAWRNNKAQRRATYTNLSPGDYTFQVRADNGEVYSNAPVKSIAIIILPPPWKTWWAYLIYAALSIIVLGAIRKYALDMLKLRQRIIIDQKLADVRLAFFTNISHELRTPLTLILNPLEEISKKESLSYQGSQNLNLVRKNAQRMKRFINQLLDLRKIESGKSTLTLSNVELVAFVKRVATYFAEVAERKQITLKVEPQDRQLFAWIDAEKMDIVIYNILGNAFKFTPNGKNIYVKIRYIEANAAVIIEIIDEGVGVAANELSDIFNLYYEGQHKESNGLKGTGIGLALSKEIVQLHHGTISAKNNISNSAGLAVKIELKQGKAHFEKDKVNFMDTIPEFEKAVFSGQLQENSNSEGSDLENKDLPLLLLVEDNSDLRSFLKIQLGSNYRVEAAENGLEGLEKALALLPDVVLSDVMMPVMDGIQMLDRLKNNPATSHIPVVLLSAKFSVESQIEGLNYGADHYIAKPFQNEYLIASLNNLILQRKRLFESILKGKKEIDISPSSITITSNDEQFLQKVIGIVEEKMADTQFNIDVVADSMNMSRSPFYKKLKSLSGLSPVEFVKEIRLKRSLQYLDAGEHNIATITYEVGFNSTKYFSTCFKQRFGQSPSDYIKANNKAVS